MSEQPRVAVVGAGLAGLAAARALTAGGFAVDLYERSRLLGGKVTSFSVDDHEVDNGQHVFLACCTEFIDFVREVGMEANLHLQRRFAVTVLRRDGAAAHLRAVPLPAPMHLLFGFALYRHLGLRDKLRVARALRTVPRGPGSAADMETWLTQHGQTEAARHAFWDPFLVPALNAPLSQVAAIDGLFVLRTAFLGGRGDARIGYLTVPLGRLAEAAARDLHAVHTRAAVTGVTVRNGRCAGLELESGERVSCDGYVLAVPPRRLAGILGDAGAAGVDGLDAFRTEPIVDVHLWYDRRFPRLDFAALLESPVQWVFAKGPGYLCCSLSAASEQVQRPERELVELCHRELAAAIPAVRRATLIRGAATRDPEATFVPAPGLRRPGAATNVANLVIAGAWTDTGWPATMESAVRSGRTAATQLAAALAAPATAARPELAHAV